MHRFFFSLRPLSLSQDVVYGDEENRVTGFHFGPKIGATLGNQAWDDFERSVMFNWHAAFFIETLDPDYKGSLFAQIGYHSRGSALRLFNLGGFFSESIVWNNLSVALGAKKRIVTNSLNTPYYFVGLRGEYSLKNNLQDIQERYAGTIGGLFYPFPEFSRDFVYGLTFGGGYEFYGTEYIQPTIELTISPDFSFQYQSPELGNVNNPFNGQSVTLRERDIRNFTLELSVVVRFKREIIYVD